MRLRASLAATSLFVAACTAGSGPPVPTGGGGPEPPSVSNEPAPFSNEPGAQGPDPAPGEGESPQGTQGACPACDTNYQCTYVGNPAATGTIPLVTGVSPTGASACLFADNPSEVFDCSGEIINYTSTENPNGSVQIAGTIPWSAYGAGGFSFVQPPEGSTIDCVPVGPVTSTANGSPG